MWRIVICLLYLSTLNSKELSIEEKVGQILLVHFYGEEVNDDAKKVVQEAHVGGIIYFKGCNGLHSPEQVATLSRGLQELASIPLLIAIDNEGGAVTHLKSGFTYFPGNWAVGRMDRPELACEVAKATARELLAVGINMNLAPVVDVNINPQNPVIGIRSFSDKPEVVTACAEQALKGYQEEGILSVLKHFPGHGDVVVDSHKGLPVVTKSQEELEKVELYPFTKLASSAEVIMSAHLVAQAIDPDNAATFSPKVMQGLLRQKLGFQGVIMSDSLLMDGALIQAKTVEEAAIRAFNAGCDILTVAGAFNKKALGTSDAIIQLHKALVQAVFDGRIAVDKLDASVARIMKLKAKKWPTHNLTLHTPLAEKIAKASVECIYNRCHKPIHPYTVIAPANAMQEVRQTKLASMAEAVVNQLPVDTDVCVVLAVKANQNDLIQRLRSDGKTVIVLALDKTAVPECDAHVITYGPSPHSLDAAWSLITGEKP